MVVFSTRPTLYKVGLVGLFVCTALFIIGFSSPFWIVSERTGGHQGLWMKCGKKCKNLGVANIAPNFHIVRALETVGLILMLLASAYGMCTNFCRPGPRPFSRALEIKTGVGGILGLTGTIVFFAKYRGIGILGIKYGWAIYLSTVGSAAAIVCAVLIGISNKRPTVLEVTSQPQQMQNFAGVSGGGVGGGPTMS